MPEVVEGFDMLNVGNWLCPPIGLNIEIFGKYSSSVYSTYGISVNECSNDTDPSRPCASQ
jgi:hypothetical protein